MAAPLWKRLLAEMLGTMDLLVVVIGSGVMGERLSGGNMALALLANALATAAGLYVLIEVLGPLSGAHMNPAVSLLRMLRRELAGSVLLPYAVSQLLGAWLGAVLAHAMFELPWLEVSTHVRGGVGQWLAEVVATGGLMLAILRAPPPRAGVMVGAYVGAAYWFTASTSFANPAAVFGRMFSDTFAGIAPASAPGFLVAQLGGTLVAFGVHRVLFESASPEPDAGDPMPSRSSLRS